MDLYVDMLDCVQYSLCLHHSYSHGVKSEHQDESPANYSFDKPNERMDWKQCFVRFRIATKLGKEDGTVRSSPPDIRHGKNDQDQVKPKVENNRQCGKCAAQER